MNVRPFAAAQNAPGAVALYERVGMSVESRSAAFEKASE